MTTVIRIEELAKLYRLGQVGTGTISHDLNRWWHRIRGRDDPYSQVGTENDRAKRSNDSADPEYVWALQDISLDVQQGEIMGIIGRNGAGKSTLLKLLSRVTAPTKGVIKTKGRIASLLEVGTGFHPELTGRENIYLNGAILGMKRTEITRELDAIVDFSGCGKYLDTPVKRYSSGMTVRLGFAVAAHLRSEILVVDEVLAVGDAEFQRRCIGQMKEISVQGRTVLFVSHNMASVRNLCTRAVLLSNGRCSQIGETDTIISSYLRGGAEYEATPLRDRTDRTGNGRMQWVGVSLVNADGQPTEDVFAGEGLEIRCSFELRGNVDLSAVTFAASLLDPYGTTAAAFISDEIETKVTQSLIKSGIVRLVIPNLWLRGGQYSLRLFASERGTSESSVLDTVENCRQVVVLGTRLHEYGKTTRNGHYAFVPATLFVEEDDDR